MNESMYTQLKSLSCPLISVIVPIYRVEKYLDRCINSIVKQTYQETRKSTAEVELLLIQKRIVRIYMLCIEEIIAIEKFRE